jgi:hypothetical protein
VCTVGVQDILGGIHGPTLEVNEIAKLPGC